MKINKKQVICMVIAVAMAWTVTALTIRAKEARLQQNLAKEVFRFHVLANSDSDRDQALKMKVKENVISYMRKQLPKSNSVDMTKKWASIHLDEIKEVAESTLQEEQCLDKVKVKITNCYFPDKTYGDITFPKGNYDALRIEIGYAQGQNWWCVLYPNLCFVDAVHAIVPDEGKEELKEVLDEEEYDMITSKFKIKWFFFR